jgi:tRNA (guanine37-N1)-methyltransferase
MFRVDVVTLFPEMFAPLIGLSIVGRAHERGLIDVRLHNLLDALGPGERADDRPYGGGPGMILRAEPLGRMLETILGDAAPREHRALVVTSAAGRPFSQADAQGFAALEQLIVICGRYEGVDQRVIEAYGAQELSLGDFVLTGGEIPAMAFVDATVRLVEGTLNEASLETESFGPQGLEGPSYTRPPTFAGIDVPAVLLSGDHAKIAAWRREESRRRTAARRPDLLPSPESARAPKR